MIKIILYWANVLQPFVVFITLLVLIKYTCETYKLRMESQRQTELSIQPLIIITKSADGKYVLKNIGTGAALNLNVGEILLDETPEQNIIYIFPSYDLAQPNIEITIKSKYKVITISKETNKKSDERKVYENDDNHELSFLLSYSDNKQIEVEIKYTNIIGQRYLTKEVISKRKIKFKSIEKI